MYALFCIFCFHRTNRHSSATLTEVFPCFFLSCKANARVYLAKTGHGPHSYQLRDTFTRLVHRFTTMSSNPRKPFNHSC